MLTIAILDNHELFRKAIQSLLHTTSGYQVLIGSPDSDDLINNLSGPEKRPSIILIEPLALGIKGAEEIKRIENISPHSRIIFFSNFSFEQFDSVILTGINGFISKNCKWHTFREVIQRISQGENIMVPDDRDTIVPLNKPGCLHKPLTEKQRNFLKLCAYPELSYKMIADHLNISPKTVDRHREELFKKLNIKSRTGLAIYAINSGLLKR